MTRDECTEIYRKLSDIEETLSNALWDALEKAEERAKREGLPFDDYTECEGERVGVIYPENAAPDLDSARHHIQVCMEELAEHRNSLP